MILYVVTTLRGVNGLHLLELACEPENGVLIYCNIKMNWLATLRTKRSLKI
jgi:hypothetical protein